MSGLLAGFDGNPLPLGLEPSAAEEPCSDVPELEAVVVLAEEADDEPGLGVFVELSESDSKAKE